MMRILDVHTVFIVCKDLVRKRRSLPRVLGRTGAAGRVDDRRPAPCGSQAAALECARARVCAAAGHAYQHTAGQVQPRVRDQGPSARVLAARELRLQLV